MLTQHYATLKRSLLYTGVTQQAAGGTGGSEEGGRHRGPQCVRTPAHAGGLIGSVMAQTHRPATCPFQQVRAMSGLDASRRYLAVFRHGPHIGTEAAKAVWEAGGNHENSQIGREAAVTGGNSGSEIRSEPAFR